jgi:hypothetical protein
MLRRDTAEGEFQGHQRVYKATLGSQFALMAGE